ncbi:hypothetical protein HZC35_02130 [Candidatus Saganbacteria bacterium]|nr:hypothetical protein [Candidatus Saganbacteria bacterium]
MTVKPVARVALGRGFLQCKVPVRADDLTQKGSLRKAKGDEILHRQSDLLEIALRFTGRRTETVKTPLVRRSDNKFSDSKIIPLHKEIFPAFSNDDLNAILERRKNGQNAANFSLLRIIRNAGRTVSNKILLGPNTLTRIIQEIHIQNLVFLFTALSRKGKRFLAQWLDTENKEIFAHLLLCSNNKNKAILLNEARSIELANFLGRKEVLQIFLDIATDKTSLSSTHRSSLLTTFLSFISQRQIIDLHADLNDPGKDFLLQFLHSDWRNFFQKSSPPKAKDIPGQVEELSFEGKIRLIKDGGERAIKTFQELSYLEKLNLHYYLSEYELSRLTRELPSYERGPVVSQLSDEEYGKFRREEEERERRRSIDN